MNHLNLFVTTARGTERALFDELTALQIGGLTQEVGGVKIEQTNLETAYRTCLWSRVASRVLMPLRTIKVTSADDLYEGVSKIPWMDHTDADRTLAVSVAGKSDARDLNHSHFVAQRTKDAIVDPIRRATGRRPSVDPKRPDIRINVHLRKDQATISMDLSGISMHQRHIDRRGNLAPLKENLAAALLWMAGWPAMAAQGAPLIDPMCGSGTFLLEAAWIAQDCAAGLGRRRHGFERWKGHDEALWKQLREEARQRRHDGLQRAVEIVGYDRSTEAIAKARHNITKAHMAGVIKVIRRPLEEMTPPGGATTGLMVVNPPYGQRLGHSDDLGPLYERLGDTFKRQFPGWTACVLTGNKALARRVGLRPDAKDRVFNGPIECQWLQYKINEQAPESDQGPGWRKPGPDAPMLVNRLKKNLKNMGRWARKNNIHCYRLYDADIPEYNLSIDLYDGAVQVQEYEPPRKVKAHKAEQRRRDVSILLPELLGLDEGQVAYKMRRRRPGGQQYGRMSEKNHRHTVREGDLRFEVNLTDYLDTGLFLDGRVHRKMLRELADGKDFLNLFAYTCTASVAAAAGGAASTTSVDLSGPYLAWGRRNFELNGFDASAHRTIKDDVMGWLDRARLPFGLIFVAPPTYSSSRHSDQDFDVQRDHVALLRMAAKQLTPDGIILFSNALQTFTMDRDALGDLVDIEEITAKTVPKDFARRPKIHNAWLLRRRQEA